MPLTTAVTVYMFPEWSVSRSTSAVPDLLLSSLQPKTSGKILFIFISRPCARRVASVIFAVLPHLFSSLAQGNLFPYITVFLCPLFPASLSLSFPPPESFL